MHQKKLEPKGPRNFGLARCLELFEAGKGGCLSYRIPWMFSLGDGTVPGYGEARKDGGDWANMDLFLCRIGDVGMTWAEPLLIADAGKMTTNNPATIPGKGKPRLHLVYSVNYVRADC